MLYKTQIAVFWYHKMPYQALYNVRAVSRKHALNKALKEAERILSTEIKRKNLSERELWRVEIEAKIID